MLWALIAVLAVLVIGFIALYNGIVSMRNLTKNAWADVDVWLKRRSELIPNLVATVKGYAAHESSLFESLARARSAAQTALSPSDRAAPENSLGIGVRNAVLLAENYPELKASENFKELQRALSETEDKIAQSRRYYNACVRDLNIKLESFPSSLVASMMRVTPESYFEIEDSAEASVPSIAGLSG